MKKTKNGKGFYNKVGCKGSKRTIRATFVSEQTATPAPKKFDGDQGDEVLATA